MPLDAKLSYHAMTDKAPGSSQLEYLQQELDRCWQDDREAKSRMLQAIAAAATVLAIVYAFIVSALSSVSKCEDGANAALADGSSQFVLGVCVALSIAAIITCISYVTAMSVISLARYSHMRELEREIIEESKVTSKDSSDLPRIGWLELRGTLATLHPNRIYNKYAAMHFMGSYIALIGAVVVCGCFILLYTQLPEYRWQVPVISVLTIVPFLGAGFYVFMQSSQHTKDILDAARDIARDSRVEFDGQKQFGDLKTVREKHEKGKTNVR